MAGRPAVVLDIGTSGVRGAELSVGKRPMVLDRFGQVALPPGAVVDGEVLDVDAVAQALRRLWSSTNFRTKRVIVGVSNQKVVVRQVALPWLPPAEFRKSRSFQVQDYIPMPVEQAVLDFHPPEEYVNESGGRMLRVLLVAASAEMVQRTVAAVQKAGLSPVMIDLTPFALLRGMAQADELGLSGAAAEALVDVGATTAPSSAPTTRPTTAPATPPGTDGMITFKLLSITANTATVSVDGKTYTWTAGKVYLGSFKLLSMGSVGDGSFLYGDMPIHISTGQTYIFSQ